MTNIQKQVLFDKDTPLENSQLAILKQHFPNCFDKHGAFLPEKLTEIVQSSDTPLNKEAYSLQWLGKSYAKLLRDFPPQTLLCADEPHNSQEDNQHSQNLLIKGDNLEVLKHLKNAYNEKVKMIYIDPPYNTGSDGFVYQDDRKFSKEQLAELTGMSEDEAERVLNFTDKKSNSHSAWLTFMYPRLYIARTLLQQDGVIFISIDDNEVAQLRLLCDEVFGEENFVGEITWESTTQPINSGAARFNLQQNTEFILLYSKNKNLLKGFNLNTITSDLQYPHDGKLGKCRFSVIEKSDAGSYKRESMKFEILGQKPREGKRWQIGKDKIEKLLQKDRIEIIDGIVKLATYPEDESDKIKLKPFWSLLTAKEFGTAQNGKDYLNKLMSNPVGFDTVKSVDLIEYISKVSTNKNDLILDFFAGSGTTADAVMQLNAKDGGNRQFILVQLPELIDAKKSKTAYDFVKNELSVSTPTIFDITKERIIRSAKKIFDENDNISGDLGFKIYETVENFCLKSDEELTPNQEMFPKQNFTYKQYQTLLTSWRLHDGNRLTDSVTTKKLADYTAYLCDKNLYLLHPNFNSASIKALIEGLDKERNFTPNRIIFYGEHIDSGKQKELQQALENYTNKKDLKISLLARY